MQEQEYSIEHRKFDIISMITQLEDIETLAAIEILLRSKQEEKWWDTISEEEKEAVTEGLVEIEESKSVPDDEIQEKIEEHLEYRMTCHNENQQGAKEGFQVLDDIANKFDYEV